MKLRALTIKLENEEYLTIDINELIDFNINLEEVKLIFKNKKTIIKRSKLYYPEWYSLITKLRSIFKK